MRAGLSEHKRFNFISRQITMRPMWFISQDSHRI